MVVSKRFSIFLFSFIILALLAGFRPVGFDRDSLNYVGILHVRIWDANLLDKEPFYWFISEFNHIIFSGKYLTFFLCFAFVGVFFKLFAIYSMSKAPLFSLILYIFLYFILHEMTQIRVGVAGGLFLLSINQYYKKNYPAYFFTMMVACLFHYTAILGFLLLLLRRSRFNPLLYISLLLFSIAFSFFVGEDILNWTLKLLPDFLSFKLHLYMDLRREGHHADINKYNIYYLSLVFIAVLFIFYHKIVRDNFDVFLIKIFVFGVASFYFFSFLPVLAFRVSEFYLLVLVILLANLSFVFKQRLIYVIFILAWGFSIFVSQGIFKNLNFEVLF